MGEAERFYYVHWGWDKYLRWITGVSYPALLQFTAVSSLFECFQFFTFLYSSVPKCYCYLIILFVVVTNSFNVWHLFFDYYSKICIAAQLLLPLSFLYESFYFNIYTGLCDITFMNLYLAHAFHVQLNDNLSSYSFVSQMFCCSVIGYFIYYILFYWNYLFFPHCHCSVCSVKKQFFLCEWLYVINDNYITTYCGK